MMGWGSQGYGMGWFGGIFMVLFWALVIAGIIFAVRYLATGKTGPGDRQDEDPLRILQQRYARGEIDTREYEEKKRVLKGEL